MDNNKELPMKFIGKGQVRGFKFYQLKKTISGYMYLVNTGHRIYFEVFKRHINRRFSCISYPKAESFGIWAWTIKSNDIDLAYKILNELT